MGSGDLQNAGVLAAVLDLVPDGVVVTDRKVVLLANRELARIFGLEETELQGKPIADLIPGEQGTAVAERWREMIEAPATGQVFPMRIRRGDGSTLLVECAVSQRQDGDSPILVIALREKGPRLLARKGEPGGESDEVQRLGALGKLAASVYHDFNNVLTAVLLYSGRLLSGLSPSSPLHGPVLEIYRAGQRGAALVSQLLSYAHPQGGEVRSFNLNALLQEQRDLLQRLVGDNVKVELDCAPGLPLIEVDSTVVERILLNLATNARDAMPEGGRFRLRTSQQFARRGVLCPVVLEVSDTGVGMDEATRARAFQSFFTTKPPGEGTGLGLSIVQEEAEQAGGFVELESEVGRGTTARIFFPPAGGGSAQELFLSPGGWQGEAGVMRSEHPARVLLVEDEDAVRRSLRLALEDGGHEVVEARSAEEAVLLASGGEKLDLLLSDLVLPGMSGRDLAARLSQKRPELRVLFVSGYPRAGTQSPEESPPFFLKPFDHQQLLRRVEQELVREKPNKRGLRAGKTWRRK